MALVRDALGPFFWLTFGSFGLPRVSQYLPIGKVSFGPSEVSVSLELARIRLHSFRSSDPEPSRV